MALETQRLRIRPLVPDDAPFILALLNDPSFLEFIGDKGVRTLDEARTYIEEGPMESRRTRGFALDLVEERLSGEPLGICGLVKRPALDDVDVGYAFLPAFHGRGYAVEAVEAVVDDSRRLGLKRLAAVVNGANGRSLSLLRKLGFRHEGKVRLGEDQAEVELYLFDFPEREPLRGA